MTTMTEKELKPYLVKYKDREMYLSPLFLKKNNAEGNLELIKKLFKNKFKLFYLMEKTDDSNELQVLAAKVTENEFKIQKAFNFEADVKFHRFWEMPKCICPTMDNIERWGTSEYIHVVGCPIHRRIDG